MNFFGKKSGHFGEEDGFYTTTLGTEELEEVAPAKEEEEMPLDPVPTGMGIGGGSIELKVVHSEKYEDVVSVAEHLLNHCTVVLDLNDANKDVRRRILDFLSGVAFSIGGQMRRVTDNTYILTPSNVDVSESHISSPVDED